MHTLSVFHPFPNLYSIQSPVFQGSEQRTAARGVCAPNSKHAAHIETAIPPTHTSMCARRSRMRTTTLRGRWSRSGGRRGRGSTRRRRGSSTCATACCPKAGPACPPRAAWLHIHGFTQLRNYKSIHKSARHRGHGSTRYRHRLLPRRPAVRVPVDRDLRRSVS